MKVYIVIERVDDELRPYSYLKKDMAQLEMKKLVEEYFKNNNLDLKEYLAGEKEELKIYGYKSCSDLDFEKNRIWFEDGSKFVAWELFENELHE